MNSWKNTQRVCRGTGRGIGCRVWIMAALAAISLSASACGKEYKPVEIPERVQSGGGAGVSGTDGGGAGVSGMDGGGAGVSGTDGGIVGVSGTDGGGAGVSGMDGGIVGVSGTDGSIAGAVVAGTGDGNVRAESVVLETILMPETVYVTGDQVNLRADASMSAEVVATLGKGTSLKRTAISETWSRVVYQEKTCYISTRYVSTTQPEPESAGVAATAGGTEVKLDSSWKYADFSKINSGAATRYKSEAAARKNITVCVNAGHGTKGGSSVKTQCHPDGTAKVTGGTTSAGATTAVAVSGGMQFSDGTAEAKVTLAMAKKLKDKLLAAGYDVLMIRETDDVQLDNIARTVIANNMADCHIALHWDSTTSNKGAFYMSVPNAPSYRNMEPVKSNWQKHNALGESLIAGLKGAGVKLFSNGAMEMDLTQTSFSTIPSIDIELGDKASDHSDGTLNTLADGLLAGVNHYFGN